MELVELQLILLEFKISMGYSIVILLKYQGSIYRNRMRLMTNNRSIIQPATSTTNSTHRKFSRVETLCDLMEIHSALLTLMAFGPFGPSPTSNSTVSPSEISPST